MGIRTDLFFILLFVNLLGIGIGYLVCPDDILVLFMLVIGFLGMDVFFYYFVKEVSYNKNTNRYWGE